VSAGTSSATLLQGFALLSRQTSPQFASALALIWDHAQGSHGGSRVCVSLLLGLYNGKRFPFELTELRCLDDALTEAAFTVLRQDALRCEREVHEWLNVLYGTRSIGARFELLAINWRKPRAQKGKAARQEIEDHLARMLAAERPAFGVPASIAGATA